MTIRPTQEEINQIVALTAKQNTYEAELHKLINEHLTDWSYGHSTVSILRTVLMDDEDRATILKLINAIDAL
jgi:hypothetical protein